MNYIQEQFIGKTFNQKLNDEIADYLCERKFTVLGYLPRPGAIAMVHTLEDGAVKCLGGSDPNDIINDNFGKWLAAMHSTETGVANSPLAEIGPGQPPVNTGGPPGTTGLYFYNSSNNSHTGFTSGQSLIQLGSGVTLPAVSDFDTETPFIGGPEATKALVNPGAYAPTQGRVSVGVNIGPTVQVGTINELAIFQNWRFGGNFMMSHDAISPGLPFVIGETIFAQYFYQI